MLSRIPFLAAHFQKEMPTMTTILTGVILAGLFAVVGCDQSAEKPAEKPAATNTNGGDDRPGHMPGGQEHGPGHQDGRGEP